MANEPITATAKQPVVVAPQASAPMPTTNKNASFLTHLLLGTSKSGEVVIYRHSSLFYWWPVWALGFTMAIITYFGDKHMAIVPAGTLPSKAAGGQYKVGADAKPLGDRNILVLPEKANHWQRKDASGEVRVVEPTIYMSEQKSVGTVFIFVLLLVIAITNVHMRGLWSFFVLLVLIMLTFIAAAAGWWEAIFSGLGQLSIHINMGGYLLLSSVLFVLWLINFAIFDRQTYIIFAPGQVRMRWRSAAARRSTTRPAWSSKNSAAICFATGFWVLAREIWSSAQPAWPTPSRCPTCFVSDEKSV